MIMNKKNNNIISSEEYRNYRFSESPIIFNILSDNLYSNKIGSIIRELASNAYDAHVAVGNENIPFKISITNHDNTLFSEEDECIFSIRDYGCGLSEKEIFELYSVYGNSNKRESNNYIGGFGIGSKSPFAYTDSFIVVSYQNGTKKSYCAFISEDGYPSIAKMDESNTTETNGFEVKFKINPSDKEEFISEVKNQLKFFKVNTSLNTLFISSRFFASTLVVVIAIFTKSNSSLFIVK